MSKSKRASKSKPADNQVVDETSKWTDERRLKHHNELEGVILDCVRMAQLTQDALNDNSEALTFAVNHLCDMVSALRELYYGRPAGCPIVSA